MNTGVNTRLEPEIPRWVWWAAGGVAVTGLAGLALWLGRNPSWDRLIERSGAPDELKILAKIQRYTESRGNPLAGLGRPELFPTWAQPRNASRDKQIAETEAATEAYERNREAYEESPFPRRMWIFGSGGAYGLIPANALAPFRRTDALRRGKVTPYDVFNPWRSTVLFIDYVWRVMQREEYRALAPQHRNILALKRSLARPSLAWDFAEQYTRSRTSRRNAENAARALGLPLDDLYREVPLEWATYPGARKLLP